MQNCDCSFTATELTKFAPFCRYESGYVEQANVGLIEIDVTCSNCKYFGKGYSPYFDSYEIEYMESKYDETKVKETFNHCHVLEGPINSLGFCRFWTQNIEGDE